MDIEEIIKKNRTLGIIFKPDLESKTLIKVRKERTTSAYVIIMWLPKLSLNKEKIPPSSGSTSI